MDAPGANAPPLWRPQKRDIPGLLDAEEAGVDVKMFSY